MIELKNLVKSFDKKTKVINNLNLFIEKGELIILIGESGCGKTTTMKMINRLVQPTSGTILINEKDIKNQDIIELRRNIGYVIQDVGLFPNMTIGENIEIVPKLKKWNKEKRTKRGKELLELVNLDSEEYYDRYPNELSGGQQQRIGVARALAVNPDIILMDEPFSALDPITKEQLQDELLRLQDELKKTIIFVTHDIDEALKLGDKIAIMKNGEILQFDSPEQILKHPINEYVEFFVGKKRLWSSPNLIYAKDIMKKNVPTIGINRTRLQAIEIMKDKEIEELIVIEKDDKKTVALGIVTIKELRKPKSANSKLKEIMNDNILKVSPETNIIEVLNLMTSNKVNVIPVLDDNNYILGMINKNIMLNIISDLAPEFEGGQDD